MGEWKGDEMHGRGYGYNEDGSLYHDERWVNGRPIKRF